MPESLLQTWSWCPLGLTLRRVIRPRWVATMFLPNVRGASAVGELWELRTRLCGGRERTAKTKGAGGSGLSPGLWSGVGQQASTALQHRPASQDQSRFHRSDPWRLRSTRWRSSCRSQVSRLSFGGRKPEDWYSQNGSVGAVHHAPGPGDKEVVVAQLERRGLVVMLGSESQPCHLLAVGPCV